MVVVRCRSGDGVSQMVLVVVGVVVVVVVG